MGIGDIVGLIVIGAVIGALARLFLPGRQNIGCLATTCVGVLGCLVGYWIAAALGVAQTRGVDWIRWIVSIAVSVVLVSVTAKLIDSRDRNDSHRR